MSVYNICGNAVTPYDLNGNPCQAYDIYGNLLTCDYNVASSDYERIILSTRDAWIAEARADASIIPIVIHTDQHGRLTTNNSLFAYLSKAVPWTDTSACIGLGDVVDYSATEFQKMVSCLSGIPKSKQINIWGNHDTWTPNWYTNTEVPTAEEVAVLNTYFDNSAYCGNVKYSQYGVESMIDAAKGVRYCVIAGWEYDLELGGHSHYGISWDGMEAIIQMLSVQDEYDIIILSHIQPFKNQNSSTWIRPPVEQDSTSMTASQPLVSATETSIDQLLIDRKNKASGTVKDSYGNLHSYDFTNCRTDVLCCFSGHDHFDKYMWQNENVPVYLFDAYCYDPHPIYFVNVDRTNRRMNIWKVDDSPTMYNYQIPFNKPTS